MRAIFANGVDNWNMPWAVEGLPLLLHLSLFLFFVGLVIYLFNVDREVFTFTVSWIGLFSMVYGFITVLPLFRHDSPYNTPLSTHQLFNSILIFLVFAAKRILFLAYIPLSLPLTITFYCILLGPLCCVRLFSASWDEAVTRVSGILDRIQDFVLNFIPDWLETRRSDFVRLNLRGGDSGDGWGWLLKGVEKKAEEEVKKRSSEIDRRILRWTISALGDDDSLEKFFEAIPGFFDSEFVNDLTVHVPYDLVRDALAGFLGRTLSSKSVVDSVKLRRLDLFMDTIKLIGEDSIGLSSVLETFLLRRWDLVPQTIDVTHRLARLYTGDDQRTALYARCTVTSVLATVRERDDRWVELAARISGLPERDLQQDVEEFFRFYLNALDGELHALLASISGLKLATAAPGVEEGDTSASQSEQTELGKRGITVRRLFYLSMC
jgi:hypothetical protein